MVCRNVWAECWIFLTIWVRSPGQQNGTRDKRLSVCEDKAHIEYINLIYYTYIQCYLKNLQHNTIDQRDSRLEFEIDVTD